MASIAFPDISETLRLANGTTYNYVHVKPQGNKPYTLFLHGFPSSSYDWRRQIPFLQKLGYGVIAPDLLGYGNTDKPSALESYRLKRMCEDLASILDHHQIKEVIAVGHDWGSNLLSRMVNYQPDRVSAYVFLDVGYSRPSGEFDVNLVNKMMQERIGYTTFGYWLFFNAPDSAEIITSNPETSIPIIYPEKPEVFKERLCPVGATRKSYEERYTAPPPAWLSELEIETHKEIFSPRNGGYAGGLNWYKAQMGQINAEDEASVPEERQHIHKPSLLVLCEKDYIAIPQLMEESMRPFAKDMEVKTVDCGHWLLLEKTDEVNEILKDFFEKQHGSSGAEKL